MSKSWIKQFQKLAGGRILLDEPLSGHTTYRVGGPADVYYMPDDELDLASALAFLRDSGINYVVIGQGANVLFPDKGFAGCVVNTSDRFNRVSFNGQAFHAQSGVLLNSIVNECNDKGLSGFQKLAGIPGTLGGAICMNAGAFGGWISDTLQSVTFIDEEMELVEMDKSDIGFGYRTSMFMRNPGLVITSCRFRPGKGSPEDLKAESRKICESRKAKQPVGQASCGSFFKNPEGNPAGELIEKAGLKGFGVGGAEISCSHANFIVNKGTASYSDIIELKNHIQKTIFEKFNIQLSEEVRIIS
ncbi:MAG TPA: UDP-N-acetylmuramate dehydrogenase [bacterium]|nr:UDP-N-acetylmuramate dehydrogenase [bacterium]